MKLFPSILASIVIFLFILFAYLSFQSYGNEMSCKKACGIYVSKVIDEACYCKTMPQTLIEHQMIKVK